ncbi:hypothetical protein SAMN03159341_101515 [Paenibacillus sp. 1_12]|nr:hypothetical protein SAMN03159341_101515 [Paenibacillus sp. 1_12]
MKIAHCSVHKEGAFELLFFVFSKNSSQQRPVTIDNTFLFSYMKWSFAKELLSNILPSSIL